MKKILITGGAGFIGSHLSEKLLQDGHDVYVLDNLLTGSLENIIHLTDNSHFHFILGSVLEEDKVNDLVKECDGVYHLAAVVGVKLVFEQPVLTITTNVKGTENVLNSALKFAKKVLLSSTSEVYGKDVNSDSQRFTESDDLSLGTSLRWSYGCSKALDEYLTIAYHREMGLPTIIVRIFNTVGPRQSGAYGMVIPRFIDQALSGQPITVYGDGEQVRSFIWVEDTVRALVGLMENPEANGGVFNIGSEEETTIKELAQTIKSKTGSSSQIVYVPYHQAYGIGFEDIRFRVPDISKLRTTVGFKPSLNKDQIIDRIIQHHKEKTGEKS